MSTSTTFEEPYVPLRYRLSEDDFSWNGPTGIAAVPEEGKLSFMLRLGFEAHIAYHEQLFDEMKAEAKIGCEDLLGNHEITPQAVSRAEHAILAKASPQTKIVYELVADDQDNWVIRWMLWHCIEEHVNSSCSLWSKSQSRPPSSQSTTPSSSTTRPSPVDSVIMSPRRSPSTRVAKRVHRRVKKKHLPETTVTRRRDFWDPVRSP
ncbi:hypothetical protein LTR78_005380 [Recurvomyces mirabilis]|uniref:Uncharacterized protein n=1 Tax=Recurvomyces mirabilis TaxID=574656 RepID=A0AAE0WN25_9PEZI|nr:hypothetical protein LTR78_005380 [Recurvomyces mirabilis]KAK5152713.1 hypothetical protein LTS14_008247 [Recurvomyces mirabilis]